MNKCNSPPKEGDLYKIVSIGTHCFELRFGYYADFERNTGEPVVIYPDLSNESLYDEYGYRITTAVQDPCASYQVQTCRKREECCNDCIYYANIAEGIGVCMSIKNNQNYHTIREGE